MDLSVFTQLYLFIAFCLYRKCKHITRVQDRGGKEFACGTSTSCQQVFAGDQSKAAPYMSRDFPF